MGRFKIPRNVGNKQLWGGMDFRGWLGTTPFIIVSIALLYVGFGIGDKNAALAYFFVFLAFFISLIGYGLFKPLPQLTERPFVYIYRRWKASRAQKKYSWGRKDE